jgi:hypothetical protein
VSAPRLTVPQLLVLADALRYGRVGVAGAELRTAMWLSRRGLLCQVADRMYVPTGTAQATFDSQARLRAR